MTDSAYRITPPGFTDDEWETFNREGILFFEDALDQAAIDELTTAVDRVCQSSPKYRAGETFGCQNIVERDPAFAALIDHPRHIGYAYDLFGELLKLFYPSARRRPLQYLASRWCPRRAVRHLLARFAAANQDRLLADRPAAGQDGQPSGPARQPPQTPHLGRAQAIGLGFGPFFK